MTLAVLPRFDVEGQIALVTGAARGLGRAIAATLAATALLMCKNLVMRLTPSPLLFPFSWQGSRPA